MLPQTRTITFLFTDIEGSTKLWENNPEVMRVALARHDVLVRDAIERNHGVVFKTIGDAFCAAFDSAPDALNAALEAQLDLASDSLQDSISIKVRMSIHTGEVENRDHDFFGQPVNRVARLLGIGHGAQVLLSCVSRDLCADSLPDGTSLKSMGEHRLKDLGRPELVFQLTHPKLSRDFPSLRSLGNVTLPNNLPQQVTSFIGREKELNEVREQISKTRLLTLTGSGGSGKTRLSIQLAAEVLDQYPDGAWLMELASLASSDLVPQKVATVLGLKEESSKPIIDVMLEYLKDKRMLIVLDNCEHLIDSCAQLVTSILQSCPNIVILATSREPLGITGERTYRVPSLSLPNLTESYTAESISLYEAVRLFIDRALAHNQDFSVTNKNAPALASICLRLDGIPLAIELAAARVRSLSVEEINRRLDQRFRLLTGGSRTALPRQQTLRSLIDWSFDLLTHSEKALLGRLSVFAGGWTFESAESVCSDDIVHELDVFDLLQSLCDKSLVIPEERGGTTRYRLLESVRQYARERLIETSGINHWQNRHLTFFVTAVELAEPKLHSPELRTELDRLEPEHDNFRAALSWACGGGNQAEEGLRLCGALNRFWIVLGYWAEGQAWCKATLDSGSENNESIAKAKVLNTRGTISMNKGDYHVAQAWLDQSLSLQRILNDTRGMAFTLNGLGTLAWHQGDQILAKTFYEESIACRRLLRDEWGMAVTLNNLGNVARGLGETVLARMTYQESLDIFRELGDRWSSAHPLGNLGAIARDEGDYALARTLHEESLAIRRELGDQLNISNSLNSLGLVALFQNDYESARDLYVESITIKQKLGDWARISECFEGHAWVAAGLGNPLRAAQLWGVVDRLRDEMGPPWAPLERERHDAKVAQARQALGDDAAFDAGWKVGQGMALDQAIELALSTPRTNG